MKVIPIDLTCGIIFPLPSVYWYPNERSVAFAIIRSHGCNEHIKQSKSFHFSAINCLRNVGYVTSLARGSQTSQLKESRPSTFSRSWRENIQTFSNQKLSANLHKWLRAHPNQHGWASTRPKHSPRSEQALVWAETDFVWVLTNFQENVRNHCLTVVIRSVWMTCMEIEILCQIVILRHFNLSLISKTQKRP